MLHRLNKFSTGTTKHRNDIDLYIEQFRDGHNIQLNGERVVI